MDVHCSTCDEPWDVWHLWQDAIFETYIPELEAIAWHSLPERDRLADKYRVAFRFIGFEFGLTVINVVRCPCCPKDAKPDPERVQSKAALEELLWNDQDALASIYEDYRL